MKKVLLLGAGMTAKPFAEYILNHNFELTVASKTLEKAEKLIGENPNGHAIKWTMEETAVLDKLISEHDITVSLLPAAHHVAVAKRCIKHSKNMLSTSYVSYAMKALDQSAKDAGILLLNEMGVDPGLDHMTAMRIIDKVHQEGGKIREFYSLCGALVAPEEADNPFRYKFSWSPRGVVMAGNNSATYLKDGEEVEVASENLFKNPLQIQFPEIGEMEVYPNRNSLAYIDRYKLPEIKTMYRGTVRYKNWCEIMYALKKLGMLSCKQVSFEGKTYKKIMARQLDVYPANMKEKVAERLHLSIDSPAIVAMEWLGLFSADLVRMNEGSTFDLTTERMQQKMMLPEGARDMVILLHSFLVENSDGSREVIKSHLLNYATDQNTAAAKTVALPAAVAVKLILDGKIKKTGVQIPVSKDIYEPVLTELETLRITTNEEWGLPESDKIQ